MAQNMKRGRNQRRRSSGPNVNRALDSNGPDVKIRGTAVQIYDKYQALARDASSSGDRIRAESLQQHAEHYYRVMKAMQPPPQQNPPQNDPTKEIQPSVEAGTKTDERSPEKDRPERNTEGERNKVKAEPAEETVAEEEPAPEEEKPKRVRRKRAPRKTATEAKSDTPSEEVVAE